MKKNKSFSYAKYGYLFSIPFVVVYAIFSLYPTLNTAILGFTDAKFYGMPAMMVGKMDGVKMYERLSSCHLRFLNNYLIYKKVYELL